MVGFLVGKEFEDGMGLCRHNGFAGNALRTFETDIALMTVVTLFLTEIAQELTATADGIICGVFNHCINSLTELLLPFFVNGRGDLDMFRVFAALQISDVRRLLLRDKVQDMFLTEVFQNHVDLLWLETTLTGDETLIDEIIVDKETTIVSE